MISKVLMITFDLLTARARPGPSHFPKIVAPAPQ